MVWPSTVSEPEADRRKLKTGGFGPAYNVQVAADLDSGALVHAEIVQQGNDEGQLAPQLEQAQDALDAALDAVLDAVLDELDAFDEPETLRLLPPDRPRPGPGNARGR